MFIWYKQCFLRLTKFQVAFSIYVLFALPYYLYCLRLVALS